MQEMTWTELAGKLAGHGLVPTAPRFPGDKIAPGYAHEADWLYDGTGCGTAGRWLVTSVSAGSIGSGENRWLIAYEIDGGKTGRVCLLVEEPISEQDDARLLAEARKWDLWNRGRPDLDVLADWVRRNL